MFNSQSEIVKIQAKRLAGTIQKRNEQVTPSNVNRFVYCSQINCLQLNLVVQFRSKGKICVKLRIMIRETKKKQPRDRSLHNIKLIFNNNSNSWWRRRNRWGEEKKPNLKQPDVKVTWSYKMLQKFWFQQAMGMVFFWL